MRKVFVELDFQSVKRTVEGIVIRLQPLGNTNIRITYIGILWPLLQQLSQCDRGKAEVRGWDW